MQQIITEHRAAQPDLMTRFIEIYQQLDRDNLALLAQIYHPLIRFEDPAHRIEGLPALERYFAQLYAEILSCRFEIHQQMSDDDQAFVQWTMHFAHPRLAQGRMRTVAGITRLTFADGLIISHRDYFDLGEMLYEAVPLLGSAVRFVKARLGQ
ncbi:nuclear transport factor 2 family protein [Ferrimonas pelagia]|uniref:Nuclear transport factor 2 family protein n=1 Tax=Ferrimonas pelagia TaxID=1177826 RepID=A0ABP9FBW2_9GAMM